MIVQNSRAQFMTLLLGVLAAVAGCDRFASPETRVERARELVAKGSYGEAMLELKNALDSEPRNVPAQLELARVNLRMGRTDPAEAALEAAREAGAPASEADTLGAELLLARGKHQELLGELEGGKLALSDQRRGELRVQALGSAGKCEQALSEARALIAAGNAPPSAHIVLAECLARRGNGAGAIATLESRVTADASDATAHMALGFMYRSSGDRTRAESAWHKAAEHAAGKLTVPQQILLHSALAESALERCDVEAVRTEHRALVASAPGSAAAELIGANVLLLDGKTEEAVAAAQRLVNTDARLSAARMLLVSALISRGNFEQARQQLGTLASGSPATAGLKVASELLTKAQASDDQQEEHWVLVALAQNAVGQPPLARKALERALQIAPESSAASLAMAQLELRSGDVPGALRRVKAATERHPDNASLQVLLAVAQSAAGEHAAAAATLTALQARTPSPALAMAVHEALKRASAKDPAAPLVAWLADHPRDFPVRLMYGESLRLAGDYPRAIEQFEICVAQQPRHAAALNNLAWLYYLRGDARAVPTARRAYDLAPKHPGIGDTYGWLLVESGNTRDGLPILQAADAVVGPAQPDIRFHYAAALARTGDTAQSRKMLEDLVANSGAFENQAAANKLLQTLGEEKTT